jgi:O-acetyl-ADP-ribose deacetylase (regulator of RNase III)
MLKSVEGDLLEADVDALVNTINTVGVMGKGIALQFKHRFPNNFTAYKQAVRSGQVQLGKMFVTIDHSLPRPRILVNFPTKAHWRDPSRYEWIEQGLDDLVQVIRTHQIRSIALPPLGCGNGQLDLARVTAMIADKLGHLPDLTVHLYLPNPRVASTLAREGTPPLVLSTEQATLLYLLFHYTTLHEDASAFVAQKLLYFLHRLGEQGLQTAQFRRHHYGPYHPGVDQLLLSLPSTHVQGLPASTAKPFAPLVLDDDHYLAVKAQLDAALDPARRARLDRVITLVDGFHSTWSLELLASVDILLHADPSKTDADLLADIQAWNPRKAELVRPYHVAVAVARLREFGAELGYAQPLLA